MKTHNADLVDGDVCKNCMFYHILMLPLGTRSICQKPDDIINCEKPDSIYFTE